MPNLPLHPGCFLGAESRRLPTLGISPDFAARAQAFGERVRTLLDEKPPNPTLDVTWRLAEALEVDPAYLVNP